MENRIKEPVKPGRLDESATKSIVQGDCNMKVVEGIIVGKRSMGRKLAFADVAILPSQLSMNDDNNCDSPKKNSFEDDIKSAGSNIRIIFLRQSFVGPKLCNSESSKAEITKEKAPGIKLDDLDEDFPKKSSSLPYGSTIVAQLGYCQKVVCKTDDSTQFVKDVWEVTRWKIKDHPRDMAFKLASLDINAGEDSGDYSVSKSADSENLLKQENTEKTAEASKSENESQKVIMGSGAMSCSTYLKIRGKAFELANQHKQKYWTINAQITEMKSELQSTHESTLNTSHSSSPSTTEKEKGDIHLDYHHGGRHAKSLRAKIFASWVIKTFFGVDPMSPDNLRHDEHPKFCLPCHESFYKEHPTSTSIGNNFHVIDVAGGKGQLALELISQQMEILSFSGVCHDSENDQSDAIKPFMSRCTIIDPMVRKGDAKLRHLKLKRAKSRLNKLTGDKSNRDKIAQNRLHSISINTKQSIDSEEKIDLSDKRFFPAITHIATCFSVDGFPALYSRFMGSTRPNQQNNEQNKSGQATSPINKTQHDLVNSRLLLLGLHPDECTEDIIDVALKYNLPFAIVPCCVFPDLFPSRLLRSKEESKTNMENVLKSEENFLPVRNYSDFLQYLMEKSDSFSMATLPFEGKNTVIYRKDTI